MMVWRLVYLGVEYSSPPASNLLNLRSPTIGEIVAGSREVWKPNICRKCRPLFCCRGLIYAGESCDCDPAWSGNYPPHYRVTAIVERKG